MNFLLDTNVISEWAKPQPDPDVVTWLADVDEDRVFISIVTLAELRYGIECLAPGSRRKRLDEWLQEELRLRFEGRVLPVDSVIADTWGKLTAQRRAQGRPIAAMDAFIAATAKVHALTLVTRNGRDFGAVVEEIVNPWDS